MTQRTLAGAFTMSLLLLGPICGQAQTVASPSIGAAVASSATSTGKIVTKDPEYLKLLMAPLSDDFLPTYSKGYHEKAAEIEGKLNDISDEKLRAQTRAEEWDKVSKNDKNRFKYEADVALNDARTAFSQKHQDAWMDLGRVTYDDNGKSLVVRSTRIGPIDASMHVSMSEATINQINEKFGQIAGAEIDRRAHDYVSKSGADSPCARNSDWCYKIKREEIDQTLRAERMMVVAQGNLEHRKIDRYLLVDYDTETVLFEVDPRSLILSALNWRFPIGPVPPPVIEPEPVAAPVPVAVAPPTQPAPSPDQHADSAAPGNSSGPSTNAASAPENPPARVKIPDSVIAAAIITKVQPQYPPKARAAQIHGDVVLHATIDKEGKISGLQVLSGDEMLAQSASEAVRQWRYKPILSDGEPIEVDTTITITFSLLE